MVITFIGHSFVTSKDKVKELVKNQVKNNIDGVPNVSFYLGGYGDFDEICAQVCRELKKIYPAIELVYVSPYFNSSAQEKIKALLQGKLYDTSIYPPIENSPPKFAILKRNEWMVTNADLIVSYIDHNYGGAYKSIQIAKRHRKKIINICDFL